VVEYTVKVATAGCTRSKADFSRWAAARFFHVEMDGNDVSGENEHSSEGKNAKWTTISKENISLSSGKHVMRIFFDSTAGRKQAGNFNWFKFTRN